MAQGKSKTKTQLPANVKAKKKFSTKSRIITKSRANAPAPPKVSGKAVDIMKTKKAIAKGVSEALETELRSIAFEGKKSLLTKKEIADRAASRKS